RQSSIKNLHLDNPEDEAKEQIFEFVVDNKLDPLLFATNYRAVSGLKARKERKEKPPRMVAFDEHTRIKLHDPSRPVVSQDTERLTGVVIQTLIADIDGKLKEGRQLSIPCHLIVRESSTSLQEQISLK